MKWNEIIQYVYDSNFFLLQRNLQEAKQKLEKKKAKVRAKITYSELIFFGQSVYGKGCNAFGQKFCFSNSIQIFNSKFQRAITKMKR